MIFETLDRIGPFVVVCSQSPSIPAKKRRVLVRCVNCNATQEMLASSLSDKRLFEQSVCSRCRPRNGNPHTWATRAKFEELKMAMEKDLAEAQAAVRETLAQLRTVLEERDKACRERDSHQQRVARLEEAIGCEFEDGGDLLEAVKGLVRERDEARAELSKLREDYDSVLEANVSLLDGAPYVNARNAYRRGAEAMREACARVADAHCVPGTRDVIRAMPIPEEP